MSQRPKTAGAYTGFPWNEACLGVSERGGGGGGGGGTWVNVCYPIIVHFLANYRPHVSHFLENVIFAIPTFYLCIYLINVVSNGGM